MAIEVAEPNGEKRLLWRVVVALLGALFAVVAMEGQMILSGVHEISRKEQDLSDRLARVETRISDLVEGERKAAK